MELAAAILIVGGVMSVLGSSDVVGAGQQDPALRALRLVSLVLGAAIAALGILVRSGRAWLVTINVVAVAAFLELRSGTAAGLVFGLLDVLVVIALARARWWFAWVPPADG